MTSLRDATWTQRTLIVHPDDFAAVDETLAAVDETVGDYWTGDPLKSIEVETSDRLERGTAVYVVEIPGHRVEHEFTLDTA